VTARRPAPPSASVPLSTTGAILVWIVVLLGVYLLLS
jgi:hypothetical protein